MYGAVPLRELNVNFSICGAAGKLDRVKVMMLTNCAWGHCSGGGMQPRCCLFTGDVTFTTPVAMVDRGRRVTPFRSARSAL